MTLELPRKAAAEMQSLIPVEAARFLKEAESDRRSAPLSCSPQMKNPEVVSERLGHASITLTMDIYSHVMPDMQQGASDKFAQMLFTKTGTQ